MHERRSCESSDCNRKDFRRGHCKYHYAAKLKSGELPRLRRRPAETFAEYAQRKRDQSNAHRLKYPDRAKARMREWYGANRETEAEKARARNRAQRFSVVVVLGGRCSANYPGICAGDFEPCLDVDHIHGGGHEVMLRKRHSSSQIAYEDLKEHGPAFVRAKYQLLCCNCHRVKTRGIEMETANAESA